MPLGRSYLYANSTLAFRSRLHHYGHFASHCISIDLPIEFEVWLTRWGIWREERLHKIKLPQCRFYEVLIIRGKVPGKMDLFLSILTSWKWTWPCKINYPIVGFCVVLKWSIDLKWDSNRIGWYGFLDNPNDDHGFPQWHALIISVNNWIDLYFVKSSLWEMIIAIFIPCRMDYY